MAWETRVQSQVESYQRYKKWYMIPPCLSLSIIRYVSRVKWSNPGKGLAPSLTPRFSSYWKVSLWVANLTHLILDKAHRNSFITENFVECFLFLLVISGFVFIYPVFFNINRRWHFFPRRVVEESNLILLKRYSKNYSKEQWGLSEK